MRLSGTCEPIFVDRNLRCLEVSLAFPYNWLFDRDRRRREEEVAMAAISKGTPTKPRAAKKTSSPKSQGQTDKRSTVELSEEDLKKVTGGFTLIERGRSKT
jgi:hypothetical protein